MKKFNSHGHKDAGLTGLKLPHGAAHIPNVGWKMFQRTSESAGSIR